MASVLINGAIFLVTLVLILLFFRNDGKWDVDKVRSAFRYFTVQSNALCAAAALLMCVFGTAGEPPRIVWLLKYMGTAAVSVTMLTVFFYLAPAIGSLSKLLKGNEFFMHLLTPLMALVSFCVFERRGMDFPTALLGMLPVILYGALYMYKVILAPEGKRWEDIYRFNQSGKWRAAFAAMLAGTFLICMALMALQRL